jgi:RimJ/RimL family protein N-acetyltransferase
MSSRSQRETAATGTIEHHDVAYGPSWASALAELVNRAGAIFNGADGTMPLSVVDLEPWRRHDAWWLRKQLEPVARLCGRAMRYVPCVGPGPADTDTFKGFASAWSVGCTPVALCWPPGSDLPQSDSIGQEWTPDGAVILLAGSLAQRLTQDIVLLHHGKVQVWGGLPGAEEWQPLDDVHHSEWVGESLHGYAAALPSSMITLPRGYWDFLRKALAWSEHGCVALARAEGWSSLAQVREDAAQRVRIKADGAPVNFHWLAQNAHRLGATTTIVHECRNESVQVVSRGLDADVLRMLCAPLVRASVSSRDERARAMAVMAALGDPDACLAALRLDEPDPEMLRASWRALAHAVSAAPSAGMKVGLWLARVVGDSPWLGEDAQLLRAAGHVAVACSRPDLAYASLSALDELGSAVPDDLVALAQSVEHHGRYEDALAVCDRVLASLPSHGGAKVVRARLIRRLGAFEAPWRVQHGAAQSPVLLDPLHEDHAALLSRQMRDPSICSMTALPPLEDGDDGRAWISARLLDTPAAYAIVHRQLGFVGYLDLRVHGATAFVCYWIGADFQGLGFSALALSLACDLALRNGVDLLLSSAFDDNERSLRTLRRCGFQNMEVRALEPDHDRTFVMLSTAPLGQHAARRRLIAFCDGTASGLRFEPPPASACVEATRAAGGAIRLH